MDVTMTQDETAPQGDAVTQGAAVQPDGPVPRGGPSGGAQSGGMAGPREATRVGSGVGDAPDVTPSSVALVLALAVAGLGHAVVGVAGIAICLVLLLSGSSLAGWSPGGAVGAGSGDGAPAEAPAETPAVPRDERNGDGHPSHGDAGDDVVRLEDLHAFDDLDAFENLGDGGDARLRIGGDPGAGWTGSRVAGRAVWVDALCRLQAEVIHAQPGPIGDTDVSDAGPSEALARSVGEVVLGPRATRSDPEPAVVRLPLSAGGTVELASVAFAPVDPTPDDPSVLVVAARASATGDRALVVALACIDTPVAGVDARARDLVGRLHLESAP